MKIKPLILSIACMLMITGAAMAQDKYEYALLKCNAGTAFFVTAETQEIIQFKVRDVEKEWMKKVNELSDKGWEVYNTNIVDGVIVYFLRKKKN